MLWKSVEPRCVPIFSVCSIASWLWVKACIQNQEASAVLWELCIWMSRASILSGLSAAPKNQEKVSIESGQENEMQPI